MKLVLKLFLILGISAFTGKMGSSQVITNSDESSNYLANQIAMSSGIPAENYRNYAKGLARTLAFLTPMQQAEVFGVGGRVADSPGALLGEGDTGGGSQSSGNVLADILAAEQDSQNSSGDLINPGSSDPGSSPASTTDGGTSADPTSGTSGNNGAWWESLSNFINALINAAQEFLGA